MRNKAFQVARDTLSRGSESQAWACSENSLAGTWPETKDGKENSRNQVVTAAGSQVLNSTAYCPFLCSVILLIFLPSFHSL